MISPRKEHGSQARPSAELFTGATGKRAALQDTELRGLKVAPTKPLVDHRAIEPEDVRISIDQQPRASPRYIGVDRQLSGGRGRSPAPSTPDRRLSSAIGEEPQVIADLQIVRHRDPGR